MMQSGRKGVTRWLYAQVLVSSGMIPKKRATEEGEEVGELAEDISAAP
jgi:hypothetical protein